MTFSPAGWLAPTTDWQREGEAPLGIAPNGATPGASRAATSRRSLPRPALQFCAARRHGSELVPGAQQEVTSLLVVVVHTIAVRVHVLVLELVGQVQPFEGDLQLFRDVPARSEVD